MLNNIQKQALDRLKRKLDTGYYETFNVKRCFCGGESFTVLSGQDRTGLQVMSKLCMHCGLIHTDPRLAESCLAEFYDQDYYPIFYGTQGGPTKAYRLGSTNYHPYQGVQIYQACAQYLNLYMPLVMEIGCGSGHNLSQFGRLAVKDRMKPRLVGLDYSSSHRAMANEIHGIHEVYSSINELPPESSTDVLILSHVLEHFSDLNLWLTRIAVLVKEGGLLYVEVPGVLNILHNPGYLFDFTYYSHLPHVYCFNLASLCFVLSQYGFELLHGDEFVRAVFRKKIRTTPLSPPKHVTNKIMDMMELLQEDHYRLTSLALQSSRDEDVDLGLEYAQKALYYKPDFSYAHIALANLFAQAKLHDRAAQHAEAAMQLDTAVPDNTILLRGRSLIYLRQYDQAEKVYKDLLKAYPHDHRATTGLACVERLRGNPKAALALLRSLEDRQKYEPQAVLEEGRSLKANGDLDEAREILEGLHRQYPYTAEPIFDLADVVEAQGYSSEALALYEQGLGITPDFNWGRYRMATVLRDMGKTDQALECVKDCLKQNPSLLQARILHAGLLAQTGRYERAIEAFRIILKNRPDRDDLLLNISDVYRYMGDFPSALKAVDMYSEKKPNAQETLAAYDKVNAAMEAATSRT